MYNSFKLSQWKAESPQIHYKWAFKHCTLRLWIWSLTHLNQRFKKVAVNSVFTHYLGKEYKENKTIEFRWHLICMSGPSNIHH